MKRFTLVIILIISVTTAFAQIPNNDFEIWVAPTGTYEDPANWSSSNASLEQIGQPANVVKDDVNNYGTAGTFTPKLTTTSFSIGIVTAYASGALSSGSITYVQNPLSFQFDDGFAYTTRPGSLTGWYMYQPQGTDSCNVWVKLTKWDGTNTVVIADGSWWNNDTVTTYTEFGLPLTYYSTDNPDTALIVILSSKRMLSLIAPDSSTLWIDNLEFKFNAGIDGVNAITNIKTYPNPATDKLMIDMIPGQYSEATVYDMTGRKIETLNLIGNQVDVSNLNNGQYILELRNRNGFARSTFAKQ